MPDGYTADSAAVNTSSPVFTLKSGSTKSSRSRSLPARPLARPGPAARSRAGRATPESGSVSSSTVARCPDAWTTRPTRPSPVTTGIPVVMPASVPLSSDDRRLEVPRRTGDHLRGDAAEIRRVRAARRVCAARGSRGARSRTAAASTARFGQLARAASRFSCFRSALCGDAVEPVGDGREDVVDRVCTGAIASRAASRTVRVTPPLLPRASTRDQRDRRQDQEDEHGTPATRCVGIPPRFRGSLSGFVSPAARTSALA